MKKRRHAAIALPCSSEERTKLRMFGRMLLLMAEMQPGFTSIIVQSKVSTNWEIWRSLSLIRTESSSRTAL